MTRADAVRRACETRSNREKSCTQASTCTVIRGCLPEHRNFLKSLKRRLQQHIGLGGGEVVATVTSSAVHVPTEGKGKKGWDDDS